jgi:hypothetical protein
MTVTGSPLLFLKRQQFQLFASFALTAACCGDLAFAVLAISNPIGKVARLFNPGLVKMEDRVEFLNRQLFSLATHNEHSLKFGLGCRGARMKPTDPPPSLTVDLGEEYPIDSLFLVPIQSGSTEGGGFSQGISESSSPRCRTSRNTLYDAGQNFFPDTGGKPVKFSGHGSVARYVRITVGAGHVRGTSEIFGLSELVVISGGFPVSFGCDVSVVGALRVKDLWYPEALTDGRMPLGIWQGANWMDKAVAIEKFEVHPGRNRSSGARISRRWRNWIC